MYAQLCSGGLQLPSFVDRFHVFPSLSPSATLLKVTLAGLPHQYGRREGGLAQLHDDMQRNLSSFGTVVDSVSDNIVEHRLPELQHNVRWVYQPLDYSSQPRPSFLLAEVDINVHATWSSMKPYCRYCHGDHSLNNCEVRQKAIICYWCNGSGHIAKYRDRKNVYGASGVPNKKSRKIPANSGDTSFLLFFPLQNTTMTDSQTSNQAFITESINLCQEEMLDNAVATKKNAKRKVMTLECDPQDAIERLRQYDNIMLESKTFSVGYLVKKAAIDRYQKHFVLTNTEKPIVKYVVISL
ncbi:hypothetical protein G6F37_011887 [Rhizopus arrhizus]|nr:hypothetical protein G6F37_011887 [Rhizopus arrhizus]